jgi:trafficking protein particle complex subunit 2
MTIVCLAFVGKTNEPVYVQTTDSDDSESLQLHSIGSFLLLLSPFIFLFVVHCALDIIDEKRGKKTPTSPSSTEMYLGQLYSVEDYRVYVLPLRDNANLTNLCLGLVTVPTP